MSAPSSDRNLLFGLLALQMDFVNREQLLDAMQAWMSRKGDPLGMVLQECGALRAGQARALEALVDEHAEAHGGARRSLAGMGLAEQLREGLGRLGDAEVDSSLAALSTGPLETSSGLDASPTITGGAWRYRRLHEHARGGLGQVSVAVDEEVGREVALKELQPQHADRADFRARFVREAEITGKLEHPGIVPVYGLGAQEDGRPYYAMRFVRGETLHQAIKRFHDADGGRREPGERELSLRALLRRFIDVCNAVAYAHSRGVIHRDLKPANVMLGEYGETLVVDWGLAKVLDQHEEKTTAERPVTVSSHDSSATEMGKAVGTPAFMPPEQARGEHDREGPASDIFSLGATLYALLTGSSPYWGRDALAQAAKGEARPARRVNPRVPAALEAVCARAMAARSDDRYASARLLAGDVERWLADEPVSTYRDPLRQTIRRWSKRNRTLVTSGVVLMLAGVVGLGGGLAAVSAEQANTARALGEAEAAEGRAKEKQAEAEGNLARAVKAEEETKASLGVAEANYKLAKKAVDDCFGIAKDHPLLQAPNLRKVRNLLLTQSLGLYKNFQQQRPDDHQVKLETIGLRHRVGVIASRLGDSPGAIREYQTAEQELRDLLKARPDDPVALHLLVELLNELSIAHSGSGAMVAAHRRGTEAVVVARRLLQVQPHDPGNRSVLAYALMILGRAQNTRGLHSLARSSHAEGADLLRTLGKEHPDRWPYRHALAQLLRFAALVELAIGSPEGVERLTTEAAELQRGLVRAFPDSPTLRMNLAVYLDQLAQVQITQSKFGHALRAATEAVAQLRKVERAHPGWDEALLDLSSAMSVRALAEMNCGKPAQSLDSANGALKLQDELETRSLGSVYFAVGQHNALSARAQALYAMNRFPEGQEASERAAAMSHHGTDINLWLARARCLARLGEHEQIASEVSWLEEEKESPMIPAGLARIWALSAQPGSGPHRPLPLRERAEPRAAKAVECLERAAREGYFVSPSLINYLDADPDLAPLRDRDDYKRFRASLRPVKPAP